MRGFFSCGLWFLRLVRYIFLIIFWIVNLLCYFIIIIFQQRWIVLVFYCCLGLQLRSVLIFVQMDKVFIIGDVIVYVCEFQKEFEEIEFEIDDLEQKCIGFIGDDFGLVEEVGIGENFLSLISLNLIFGVEIQGVEYRVDSNIDKFLVNII